MHLYMVILISAHKQYKYDFNMMIYLSVCLHGLLKRRQSCEVAFERQRERLMERLLLNT